jgi:hypothetical protein
VYSLFCPRSRNKEVENGRNHPLERTTQVIVTDEQHAEAVKSDGPLYGLSTTDEGRLVFGGGIRSKPTARSLERSVRPVACPTRASKSRGPSSRSSTN